MKRIVHPREVVYVFHPEALAELFLFLPTISPFLLINVFVLQSFTGSTRVGKNSFQTQLPLLSWCEQSKEENSNPVRFISPALG